MLCVAAAAAALQRNPSDVWAMVRRGLCQRALGQDAAALQDRQVASLHPAMPELVELRAWIRKAEVKEAVDLVFGRSSPSGHGVKDEAAAAHHDV